jgi:hypothetical protein
MKQLLPTPTAWIMKTAWLLKAAKLPQLLNNQKFELEISRLLPNNLPII